MKYLLGFSLIFFSFIVSAQQTLSGTILHDNIERSYILYVPAAYNIDEAVPLLFNFHGYTSSAQVQMFYGDFRPIADRENFIVILPQGTFDDNGEAFWNANFGLEVDDIGLTAALIEKISSEYSIDQRRIYSTGMSNGGFMSYALACDLSDKIAAIASVTGSMTRLAPFACQPGESPVPVMEIHGTADGVVPYAGTGDLMPIDDVINFWTEFNQCNSMERTTEVPDINTSDGSTVEHSLWVDCDNNTTCELFKVINGGHTWPGSTFGVSETNHDIDASEEIWRFFSQYDIDGKITTGNIENGTARDFSLLVLPNPFVEDFSISYEGNQLVQFAVYNALGEKIWNSKSQVEKRVNARTWNPGVYYFHARDLNGKLLFSEKILKSQK